MQLWVCYLNNAMSKQVYRILPFGEHAQELGVATGASAVVFTGDRLGLVVTKSDLLRVWSCVRHSGVQCLSVGKRVDFKEFFCSLDKKTFILWI